LCTATIFIDIAVQHKYIALQQDKNGAIKMTKKISKKSIAADTKSAPKNVVVTKIVTVNEDPKNGVEIMTKATDQVEEVAATTTAKAKEFFADMQVKAGEAAEKGKKLAADSVEFSKANFSAMVEAGKIAAKGAQEIGQTNVEFAKSNFAEMQVAVKEIVAVRTPTDFVKVQSELVKKGFDTAVSQGSKNTEAMVKLVSEMFQPISNRIAVTTDLFKKAA
jgi:phasin family protein